MKGRTQKATKNKAGMNKEEWRRRRTTANLSDEGGNGKHDESEPRREGDMRERKGKGEEGNK